MDKIKDFIDEEVNDYRLKTEAKENETKEQFFTYLLLGYSVTKFKKWVDKKWDKSDRKQMATSKVKLEELVDKVNEVDDIGKTKNYFELIDYKRLEEVKKSFTDELLKYYEKRQEIAEKVPNKAEYLKDFVDKYDKQMANVPYFKNGKVYSWHTLSDYTSMIYNTNLTRSGWNRTLTDADRTGKNLLYITAHPFACPLCMQYQGKYYSTKKNDIYPYIGTALDGGIGHPHCKHVPTIATSPIKMQDDDYNSVEWQERYEIQQKIMAVERNKEKLRTDLSIYEKMGDQTKIDLTKAKIKKLNQKNRELKASL